MRYGFIIDNRKCIGCHACTTACKSEHDVPIGVNRTWVKQVEKGVFPNSRRLFSVMRCNHCTDAPCVTICPTEALFKRDDGIVDFDKDRCIGCKSCMQACPYDALYIDPDTNTAAKCNYCAHRIDIGLEPACVNVCPEEAIISGDMDDPGSNISQLLAMQPVKARKTEKGTKPNLFYIDADDASLNPTATEKTGEYFWSSQSLGVGHFAKEAEKLAYSNDDVLAQLMSLETPQKAEKLRPTKTVEVIMDKTKRTYDTPDKGILWGWEVSAYVWTKAISAGSFLMSFLLWWLTPNSLDSSIFLISLLIGLVFLGITGILLVKDLDKPGRFLNVLFRPQWDSWLVKGAYAITIFGGLLSLLAASSFFNWGLVNSGTMWLTAIVSIIVAVYTALLFGQAKGRDFWQSPTLSIHMLVHSIMAGAAVFGILNFCMDGAEAVNTMLTKTLWIGIGINLFTLFIELITTHPTDDAKLTVDLILKGRYKMFFWLGIVLLGNLIPIVLLQEFWASNLTLPLASIFVLLGIYITEHVWVEAPQRIPLS
jgi:Fe-S-cluster-containing dehydrogenase component/formate-dependent nitrite reductase membrane component NrfD